MSNESAIPTPATPDVCTVAILVDGQEISGEFHVLSISVSREINRIPAATLQIQDGEPSKATFAASNTEHFIPGKQIDIQLGYRSQNTSVFKGVVIRSGIKIRKQGTVLNVECRGAAIKMTQAPRSRYFIDRKDSELIEELIDAHALKKQVETTGPALKQVVQFHATDWDFMVCRAEANGLVVIAEDQNVSVSKPAMNDSPVVQIAYGSTVLELDCEVDARLQNKDIKAVSWSPTDQKTQDAQAREPTVTAGGNLKATDLAQTMGSHTLELKHTGFLDQPELQAWADARLLRERLARVRGRAKCQGFAGVTPGKIVEVTGIGDRFAGKMYASGVRHTVANGNWETDIQFGLSPETFAETFDLRPAPVGGLLPMVSGLQIGVVSALEGDPLSESRIRVRLPMVSASDDGVWARLATLDAGKNRGTYFRPEVGDEVLVGHLFDDPRHPVILGAIHSSSHEPPQPIKDDNHLKGYVSREKLKLSFDDEKKAIRLETPGGNKLLISDDAKGIAFQDQNGNKITLDDKGIRIESAADLTVKAAKDAKMSGANVEVSAQSSFKASGAGTAEVSAATTSIKGSAQTVVQGGIVQIN